MGNLISSSCALGPRIPPILIAAALAAAEVSAQTGDPLTSPYPPEVCASCAGWNEPQASLRIHGDTYYVGTRGLAAILITSPEGHILIDAGLPDSAPLILENIRALGFDPANVELILNTHSHFDHAGGIAAIQRSTGARVAGSERAAPVLEAGQAGVDDPQFGVAFDFPAVLVPVERFGYGDILRVGPLAVTALETEGHAPGGTSWTWRSCEAGGECVDIVYADSQTPISTDDFRFTDSPSVVTEFRRAQAALESVPCDLLITPHPGASSFWERYADGAAGLVDPTACARYVAAARQALADRLAREQ